jgi:hypothetical protein
VMALTDSVAVFENVVVDVQFTVVWPLLGFCTSMLDAPRAATLPVAPVGAFGVDAAPAVDVAVTAANSAAAPVPRMRAQLPRGVRRSVGVSMGVVASFCFLCVMWFRENLRRYSVRNASIGASEAARLAG